jgi:hypothetical protein
MASKYGVPKKLIWPEAELLRDIRMDDDDVSDLFLDIGAHFGVDLLPVFEKIVWPMGRESSGKPVTFDDLVAITQAAL